MDDPYKLDRFVRKQADHECALRELRAGRKEGCWSWWIFPTPPFIKNGRRCGSGLNKVYEIEDDEEGLAFLELPPLRSNYLQILAAVNESLDAGVEPKRLLGIDVPRAEASARYFEYLAGKSDDAELARACRTALELLSGAAKKKRPEHAAPDSILLRKKARADHATAGLPVSEAPPQAAATADDGICGAATSEEAVSEEAAGEVATSNPTSSDEPPAGGDEQA